MEQEKEAKKVLATLDVKRKALEIEMNAIVSELTSKGPDGQPPMGLDTPLTDVDGYPRADIDVLRARTLRQRLAVIRTDHKALMKDIEQGLMNVSALKQPEATDEEKAEMEARLKPKPKPKFDKKTGKWVVMNWDGSVAGVENGDQRSFHALEAPVPAPTAVVVPREEPSKYTEPFAMIDGVAACSPAQEAGLKEGDLVVEFGGINHTNHRNLMALGEIVPEAASNSGGIPIIVSRQAVSSDERIFTNLMLYPRPWEGRGMLGCHIVKYTAK